MQQTIYLDVLVLLNIYISYFLLIATAKLMSHKISKWRLFIGSILGGVYSLIILFDLSTIELIIIKLIMGISLVFLVFYSKKWQELIKSFLYFILTNFIYAGLMLALWLFASPANMTYKNMTAYFDISALTLAISTVVAYLAISLFCFLLNKRNKSNDIFDIKIEYAGRQVIVKGFVDTGNKLVDIFTGLPVIVCEFDSIKDIIPIPIRNYFISPADFDFSSIDNFNIRKNLMIIPINSVNGYSSFPAFKPDKIMINDKRKLAVIAVTVNKISNGSYEALINESLL